MKVVCLLTGNKYPPIYADRLYKGLARNTTLPFDFECIRETKYPGWWGKIELFAPKERTVVLDVDLVITGNVDFLFEYEGQFCAWKDPWADGLNGSVHNIGAGYGHVLKDLFERQPAVLMNRYQSDQEFLRDHTRPDYWPNGFIQSYKAQSLEDGPKDARIVVFHGNPKMHEINSGWVKDAWR